MQRILLGLVVAAAFAMPASTANALLCGGTFQPPCDTCVHYTGNGYVCSPVNIGRIEIE